MNEGKLVVSTLNNRHELWNRHRSGASSSDRNLVAPAVRTFTGHSNTRHSVGSVVPSNFSPMHPDVLISGSETSEVHFDGSDYGLKKNYLNVHVVRWYFGISSLEI